MKEGVIYREGEGAMQIGKCLYVEIVRVDREGVGDIYSAVGYVQGGIW